MKVETIIKIGFFLIVINTIILVVDYIVNGELTSITGYATLVGFAGFMVFMLGIAVGCGAFRGNV